MKCDKSVHSKTGGEALQSIKDSGLFIKYQKNIYTKGEDATDYWNGLGIFILQK